MNVQKLIEKGEDAFKKKNYDYAISIFLEAVSFAPNNRPAREGLRRAELKKYENAYPSKLLLAIFGLPARLGMLFAGLGKKGNPEGYMMACERYLTKDPKNRSVNMALGDTAAAAGHLDAAIFAFETASEQHPGDLTSLKHLGNLLWKNGEHTRAHAVFDKVVHLAPHDQEAVKARKNLAAEVSLKETGFESARSSRELVKDKDAAGKLEQEGRMYRTETDLQGQVEELREKVAADPANTELLQDLAEALARMKDYDGAIAALDKAVEAKPGDNAIAFARGDLRMEKLEAEALDLRRAGKADEAERRKVELRDLRVEEYQRRLKAYPTDLNLRFKLGELLLERGELEPAIGEFQQTVRDPKFKSESQLRLGRAFSAKGQYDLAVRQLEQALADQSGMSTRMKEILYALGDTHEKKGDAEAAREAFSKIYEVDIAFRDVGERLDKLASAG